MAFMAAVVAVAVVAAAVAAAAWPEVVPTPEGFLWEARAQLLPVSGGP